VLGASCVISVVLNVMQHQIRIENEISRSYGSRLKNPISKENFLTSHHRRYRRRKEEMRRREDGIDEKIQNVIKSPLSVENEDESEELKLGSLSCSKYGGPSDEFARKEMVYWNDIPSDANFISPYSNEYEEEKYFTFEPDGGGWNNIRMAMETVILMACSMGRTLVMPPSQNFYLLAKRQKNQTNFFSFADFFPLEEIESEHKSIKMISMEEFLNRMAMTGRLVNTTTGKAAFPPDNRTNWNGRKLHEKQLWEYLRDVTDVRNWKPGNCILAFPSSTSNLNEEFKSLINALRFKSNAVASVKAPAEERIKDMSMGRRALCMYDKKMQESTVVHFMCNWKQRARLLTHFYTFLFFADWRQDLWAKRFVRDHLRYIDKLQCAAAKIVEAIRDRARKNEKSNEEGLFDSLHVRRGDFQYKKTRIPAQQYLSEVKNIIKTGSTIYIATDERGRKKDFFKPLAEHYDLCYLDDFKHLIEGFNINYYGMLDQLIASKGRIFFGTFFSTFTGYITRMRAYHSTKDELDGYQNGILPTTYYFLKEFKNSLRSYKKVDGLYAREFPVSWRDIDQGIEEISASY